MPVVINEIVFKGEISPPSAPGGGRDRAPRSENTAADKRALIEECVERVVRLLEREKER